MREDLMNGGSKCQIWHCFLIVSASIYSISTLFLNRQFRVGSISHKLTQFYLFLFHFFFLLPPNFGSQPATFSPFTVRCRKRKWSESEISRKSTHNQLFVPYPLQIRNANQFRSNFMFSRKIVFLDFWKIVGKYRKNPPPKSHFTTMLFRYCI